MRLFDIRTLLAWKGVGREAGLVLWLWLLELRGGRRIRIGLLLVWRLVTRRRRWLLLSSLVLLWLLGRRSADVGGWRGRQPGAGYMRLLRSDRLRLLGFALGS